MSSFVNLKKKRLSFCVSDLIFQLNIYLQAGQTFCPVLWIAVLSSQNIFKHFKVRSLTVMFQGNLQMKLVGRSHWTDGFL